MAQHHRANDRPAQRVVARRCRHCREPFEPTRPHQAFCRPSCRWAGFKARREPQPRALFPELIEDALFRVPFE